MVSAYLGAHEAATVLLPDRTVIGVMGWSNTAARYQHIIAAIRRDVAQASEDCFGRPSITQNAADRSGTRCAESVTSELGGLHPWLN